MTKQEFKQKCIELRRQNYTLGEMVKLLDRPKTTIYFHVQNLPITPFLKEKISQISRININGARAKGLTTQKGRSWLNRHCKEFINWSLAMVNLVAHIIFDGEIRNCSTMYHNRSLALINNFRMKMKRIYSYEPRIHKKSGDVITLAYHNVELTNFLRIKKEELIKEILNFPKNYQREFLKAFFDDEGCIYFHDKARRVKGYQHDNEILVTVQKLLSKFGIDSRIDNRFYEIIINRKENLKRFAKEINFSAGVRVNGKRTNSIWKKDLEKRKILEMALTSYSN